MKSIVMIIGIMLMMGCALVDYGNATIEAMEMLSEGVGKEYVEVVTKEEYDKDNIVCNECYLCPNYNDHIELFICYECSLCEDH